MHKKYLYIILVAIFCLTTTRAEKICAADLTNKFTVVIDAGHGGHDPGAIGRRGKEKNINLEVALKLGKAIERNCKDTRVVYTRKRDVFIPLHKRAEIANDAKADLFISIHTNSLAKRSTRISGTETYTLGLHKTKENLEVAQKENAVILIEDNYQQQYAGFNPNSAESYIIFEFMQDKNMSQSVSFASKIQKEFRGIHRTDRGVHQAGFLVLRETSMPSVLVELGYISNPNEEHYLLSEEGTSALANSIYKAFVNYKREGNSVTTKVNLGPSEPTQASRSGKRNTQASANQLRTSETRTAASEKVNPQTARPVFKIQILTSDRLLPSKSRQFKGLAPVEHYKEKGIYKYTYGADTDYNKILRLKRSKTHSKFKDAFIIAFKNGKKMNVNQAIKEFKQNRK